MKIKEDIKDFIYVKSKVRRAKMVGALSIILLCYLFFFTSNQVLPMQITTSVQQIGDVYSYSENRSVTMYEATYDKDKKTLECVLSFENMAYDNVNDYYFFLVPQGKHRYKNVVVETVLSDAMVTVIRVENLKPFEEAQLVFAPKISENLDEISSAYVGTIVLNKNNLTYDALSDGRTKSEYIALRMAGVLSSYEQRIASENAQYRALSDRIAALEKENQDLEENMRYLLNDEQTAAEQRIEANKEAIDEAESQLLEQLDIIDGLNEEYEEALALLESL